MWLEAIHTCSIQPLQNKLFSDKAEQIYTKKCLLDKVIPKAIYLQLYN